MTWDVLGLGCAAFDRIHLVDAYPPADGRAEVRGYTESCGGLSATALVAVARLGGQAAYGGRLGTDDLSRTVEQALAAHGVDVSPVVRDADAHPIAADVIVERGRGTRTLLVRIPQALGADDHRPSAQVLRGCRVLLVDQFGPRGGRRAAEIARAAGIPIVGDFDGCDGPDEAALMDLVDHLVLSRAFALRLTGATTPAEAADRLWRADRSAVVITCGRDGGWVRTADDARPRPFRTPPIDVVDSTGCGDVFHGAYAFGLARGLPMDQRLRLAAATAALKAAHGSGWAAIPDGAAVQTFLDRTPIRPTTQPLQGDRMTAQPGQRREMEEALGTLPLMDAHTHLVGGRLGARGLHDVLLYHMVVSDLYGAGCPSGARLTQHPGWPSRREAEARVEEALPFLPLIRNTGPFRGVRLILEDLYDWREPLTAGNWRRLDAQIRERADDRSWQYGILDRLNIRRTVTEYVRREDGSDDRRLQYSLEWGMFARCQWGEYDTPVYELERCWGQLPGPAAAIGGTRPRPEREIRTVTDAHEAMDHYLRAIPYADVVSTAAHISTDIEYRAVSEAEMAAALQRRGQAGPAERNVYSSYLMGLFLGGLERAAKPIVFQFSIGAEPLPFETASRVSQRTIADVGELCSRFPRLKFQAFLGSRHANQAMCTLARELPNLSLAGYWWHNFFPDAIRQVMTERLEMLPLNKQVGFFSDAYCVEWTYAKAVIVRKILAGVLADKVADGQHRFDEAVDFARQILFETPRTLLSMVPIDGRT